jgi:hypothetical protein
VAELTPWFKWPLSPARAGWYDTRGSMEQRLWWDGCQWRDGPNGLVVWNSYMRDWRGRVAPAA